jgi:hypothetical protein
MHLAAGQPPQQEAVDRAEGEFAFLGPRARAVDMIEDPGELGAREIGIEQQPGLRAHHRLGAVGLQLLAASAVRRSCHTIALWIGLPVARSHTTTVSRWLVMPIAAISLAESRPLGDRLARGRERVAPDILGIMLDPA